MLPVLIGLALWCEAAHVNSAEYRCRDPQAEKIRKALKIHHDLDEKKRTLTQCMAKRWPSEHAGQKDLWILAIAERRWPSEGGEFIFQLFVARQQKESFISYRRSDRFGIKWVNPPRWEQKIAAIHTDFDKLLSFPVFGVTIRANFGFKMASFWYEKLVLFNVKSLIEPVFSTNTGLCDCRVDDEMYPRVCFGDRHCPGPYSSATISYAKDETSGQTELLKTFDRNGVKLRFKRKEYLGWYADPLAEPTPPDIIEYEHSDAYY
jgi:hypothetical protein